MCPRNPFKENVRRWVTDLPPMRVVEEVFSPTQVEYILDVLNDYTTEPKTKTPPSSTGISVGTNTPAERTKDLEEMTHGIVNRADEMGHSDSSIMF